VTNLSNGRKKKPAAKRGRRVSNSDANPNSQIQNEEYQSSAAISESSDQDDQVDKYKVIKENLNIR
jgi:hypothetical protein